MIHTTTSRKVFVAINYTIFLLFAVMCLFPILNLAAISLSQSSFAEAGTVGLIPKGFTLKSYEYVFSNGVLFQTFFNSVIRIILGPAINVGMILLASYPLARPGKYLPKRGLFSWFFIITMLFAGGLVPSYMLITSLHLNDTILSLVLPGAVPVFNMILMINFFRSVPEELYEAAVIDGAGELRIMGQIFVPLSIPSVITVTLFAIVSHWNAWFDGVLYMSTVSKFPLQSYLQTVVVESNTNLDEVIDINYVSQVTVNAARLFLAVIPMSVLYISLQRFFVKGLTMGGVKG